MTKTWIVAFGLAGIVATASQSIASESPSTGFDPVTGDTRAAKPEFLGVDLDNGDVYYDGRNTGRYCLYRTVDVFNRHTGYIEPRRVRRCGRGLYVR